MGSGKNTVIIVRSLLNLEIIKDPNILNSMDASVFEKFLQNSNPYCTLCFKVLLNI